MDTRAVKTIGILGAGKLGIVIAQLAIKAGYEVYIAASGEPGKITLTTKILAPGAQAVTKEEAALKGDLVLLSLPLSKYRSLPTEELKGKIVIDAMNYWDEVDGPRSDTLPDELSSSVFIQAHLKGSTVVKALSHMGYHELHDMPLPAGSVERKAIAVATDDAQAAQKVADFIDAIGFDPVTIGDLEAGKVLEPGQPGFGVSLEKTALLQRIIS